jgi:predicted RNase H-like HicB family nuclease
MKYTIVIEWSEEDETYIASVPALPGCKSHGDTYELALAMVQRAATAWEEIDAERKKEGR